MKTGIIKYLALLTAPIAMLLSCEREPLEPSEPKDPSNQVARTVHYRATVSEGEGTRATLGGGHYVFQTGDRLFVKSTDDGATAGINEAGWLSGVLTLVSGAGQTTAVFEGDLTLDTGDRDVSIEDYYLADATLSASLVSTADRIHDSDTGDLSSYPSDEYGASLADAVAKFSHFTATSSFSAQSFTLSQQSCFLVNTVTFEESVQANSSVTVKIFNNYGDQSQAVLRDCSLTVGNNHQAVFVAAFPEMVLNNAKLWVKIENNADEYLFNIKDQTLAANNYYNISRSAFIVQENKLFAIKARQNTTVTFNYTTGLQYSSDRLNWTAYSSGIPMAADEVLFFRATGTSYKNNGSLFTVSSGTGVYIYGDIMSLMSNSESVGTSAFEGTFKNATWIDIPPDKDLTLSATTLSKNCYKQMFMGCTSLSKTPVLPDASLALAESCYESMFQGCTSLTAPVSISASVLAANCCKAMYQGCTSLNLNPSTFSLPGASTALAESCYSNMFNGCTGITSLSATLLPATTLANSCYNQMFQDCINLSSLPDGFLPATTLALACYRQMFMGCSNLATVPDDLLPATTLANGCYANMFNNCGKLTSAPELNATVPAPGCYFSMFRYCKKMKYLKCALTKSNFDSMSVNQDDCTTTGGGATTPVASDMAQWTKSTLWSVFNKWLNLNGGYSSPKGEYYGESVLNSELKTDNNNVGAVPTSYWNKNPLP